MKRGRHELVPSSRSADRVVELVRVSCRGRFAMTTKPKRRRAKPAGPEAHRERLLKILTANLKRATEPALRQRLERALGAMREKRGAA